VIVQLGKLPDSMKNMTLYQTVQPVILGAKAKVYVCDKEMCNGPNGAVVTSSFGHVVIAVALLINVIIGYLL